jgi:hypothetical protein
MICLFARPYKLCKEIGNCVYSLIEVLSCNHCLNETTILISYSECVSVTLILQYALRMRRVILSSLTCLNPPYFSISNKKSDS